MSLRDVAFENAVKVLGAIPVYLECDPPKRSIEPSARIISIIPPLKGMANNSASFL